MLPLPAAGRAPTVPAGEWQGSVLFQGQLVTDTTTGDRAVRTVDGSSIDIKATVASKGDIENGTMTVNIAWSDVSTGTSPGTGTPYRATSSTQETGLLTLGGGVDKFVAAGTLNVSRVIHAGDGTLVSSSSRQVEVTWIFTASNTICDLVSGRLESGQGGSLLPSAAIPTGPNSEGDYYENRLVAAYELWPVGKVRGTDDLLTTVAQLSEVINQVLTLESPSPAELLTMVTALEELRRTAAAMADCGLGLNLLTDTGENILAVLINELIAKALQQADQFTPQELIQLLNIGFRTGAVAATGGIQGAAEVYTAFEEALGAHLEEAIAAKDVGTVVDIAMAAGQYGFGDLYDQAVAAYKDLK